VNIPFFLLSLAICGLVLGQKDDDDETVYLLKKGLHVYMDSSDLNFISQPKPFFYRKNIPDLYGCPGEFKHGLASGDPTSEAVIIWTRWTPPSGFSGVKVVNYQVATVPDFSSIEQQGVFTTDSSIDYTVKIDVQGLDANQVYFYRFFTPNDTSIIGRTKTVNISNENVRLAFVNCNDYTKGYFNTYKALADRNDIDAVVHLGDYIYEQGGGTNDRSHDPPSQIWQLNDYRTRYSQYKLDNYLGKSHQLYPFIQIWDDHDIVVDAVSDTSLAHQAQYGSYQARKWAAVKAFREWNPVRDDTTNFIKNWRKFSFGNTVEMFVLDVRLYDRDRFPQNTNDTIYDSPFAKMLGPEQLNWLLTNLQQSTAKWKIIANGLMFSQLEALGTPLVLENWDGYNHERNQIFQLIKNQNISNVIVYSGDFHCAFANNLSDNPYNLLNYNPLNGNGSLAVEFIPPSASSDNFDEGNDFGLGAGNSQLAQTLITTANPHVKYVNLNDHGFGLLDLNTNRAQNEFWYVNTLMDAANTTTSCGSVTVVNDNSNKITAGNNPLSFGNLGIAPLGCFQDNAEIGEHPNAQNPGVLSCFPNPFSSEITFQILGEIGKTFRVELYNSLGQAVADKTFYQNSVIENFHWEIPRQLPKAPYVLKIIGDELYWLQNLIKQ